jgi:hypothetical protein
MADRLLVVYKSPLQRIIETVLVLAGVFASAALWQQVLPTISCSYIIVLTLFAGFALVVRLGSAWAIRRGNDMMTREERNRRYLSEIGPLNNGNVALNPVRRRTRSR